MEAQVWTLIAINAATLFGAIFYLGQRIDALGSSLGSRIDALSGRIDGIEGRVDGLSARIEEQGRFLGNQIYELGVKLDDHLRRHAS